MGDLTKTFSVCAKSFGHPPKPKNGTEIIGNQTAIPEIYGEDDSAKSSLWCLCLKKGCKSFF